METQGSKQKCISVKKIFVQEMINAENVIFIDIYYKKIKYYFLNLK